jgi:hypothetical protein
MLVAFKTRLNNSMQEQSDNSSLGKTCANPANPANPAINQTTPNNE